MAINITNGDEMFDGEVQEEIVFASSTKLSDDELKIAGALAWLEEVESINPEIGEELRQRFKAFLPENLDDLGVQKYQEPKYPRVMKDGEWRVVPNTFPEDCPIRPLGKGEFGQYYFLDSSGDLIYSNIRGQQEMEALFGTDIDYLMKAWPNAKPEIKGNLVKWKADGFYLTHARQCLVKECSRKGKFDALNKVRGRGGWLDDDGNLLLHLGDVVWFDGQAIECGQIGEHIYPSRAAIPRPTSGTAKEFNQILELFKKWNWVRPDKDPFLLLGWLGVAIYTAAIEWRPMIFMDADKGAGKSTLQHNIRAILKGRVHELEGATEAALRGAMGIDAVAISFDELEPDQNDPDRGAKIIRLARLAASGGRDTKGTKDQGVKEFTLRAPMLFSAINIPKMTGADADRFAFLKIRPIPKGAPKIDKMKPKEGIEWGQKLSGRMVAQFGRWHQTFSEYHDFLQEEGHSSRSADQFGTLLAAADLLLYDEFDSGRIYEICKDYHASILAECQNTDPNWFRCYRHILQHQPDVWRGTFPSIGEKIGRWIKYKKGNQLAEDDPEYNNVEKTAAGVRASLNKAGLDVVGANTGGLWLAIPISHPSTAKIFKGTDWQNWAGALEHAPKEVFRKQQTIIGGVKVHCVQLRLDAQVDFGDGELRAMFELEQGDE